MGRPASLGRWVESTTTHGEHPSMGMVYFNLRIYHQKSTKYTSHTDPMGYGEANANDPSVFQRFGVWYIWYFGRVLLQECLLRNTEPYDLRGFCCIIIPPKQGEANYFGNDQAEAGKGLEKELPLLSSGNFSTGPTERTSKYLTI